MDGAKANRDLNELHPKVKALAEALIKECKNQGINVGISETYRSVERQDYLYAQGRTRPGGVVTNAKGSAMGSYHQWRLAFDVFNNVKGKEYDTAILSKIGAIGEKIGLEWGGSWRSFKDMPHFQYTFGLSIADLKAGKKPPVDSKEPIQVTKPKQPAKSTQPVKVAAPVKPVAPVIDQEYEDAVGVLKQKGIITSIDAWYPDANTLYVEQLIKNMMPSIVDELSYEYHIKILNLLGILTTPDTWLNKEYKEEYIKVLIKKVAQLLK